MRRTDAGAYMFWNVAGMLGLSGNILADTFFVSDRLGADGLAALNLAVSIFGLINGIGMMFGIGGATRYAVRRGRKEDEEAGRAFTAAVCLGAAAGGILAAAGSRWIWQLARFLGAEGEILPACVSYLEIILLFAPMFICNHVLTAFVRSGGRPGLAMAGMLAGSLSNIFLDYLFMYPFQWGIRGAAFATALAPVIGAGFSAACLALNRHRFGLAGCWKPGHFRLRLLLSEGFDLIRLGGAAFVNESSASAVMVLFNLLVLRHGGNTGVAAYGIVANLALVAMAVFTGISQGCQPLISRAYGEGNGREADGIYRKAGRTAAFIGTAAAVSAWIFAPQLAAMFCRAEERALQAMAENGLRLYFTGFLFVGGNLMTAAFLGAVERAGTAFRLSLYRGILGTAAAALLFSQVLGLAGVWLAFPAAEFGARLFRRRLVSGDGAVPVSGTGGAG